MVSWTDPAKADLRAIHDLIAHDSSHYAKKVTQDIVAKMDILDELPPDWTGRAGAQQREHPGTVAVFLPYPLRDQGQGCLRVGCDPQATGSSAEHGRGIVRQIGS